MADTLDLTSLGPLVEEEVNAIVRRIGLGILVRNIKASPVDTGRFRSNWNVSFGAPSTTVTTSISTEGAAISAAASEIQAFDVGASSSIYLTNNLPYAESLANGTSTQAPPGWIDTNIRAELKAVELASGT